MNYLQALYGGTFDPIHYGHLKPLESLASLIGLRRIVIIPNNIPPHRLHPKARSEQRKEMLKLALVDNPLFTIDDRELCRKGPSYISQTLQEWREEQGPNKPLAFIIGQDSLLTFPSWYQYETIVNNNHLIICRRPGYSFKIKQEKYQQLLKKRLTYDINDLYTLPAGKIYLAETPYFNISATLIRYRLQKGISCERMLPQPVLEYILQHRLYQKVK